MKREVEINSIVDRLQNNPTAEEAAQAAQIIIDLYRECNDLELEVERVSNDYWSK